MWVSTVKNTHFLLCNESITRYENTLDGNQKYVQKKSIRTKGVGGLIKEICGLWGVGGGPPIRGLELTM